MDFIDHSTAAMAVFNLTLLKNDEIEAKRLVDYPYTQMVGILPVNKNE